MRDGRICGGKHSLIAGISSAFATHIYNKSRLLLPNPKPYYEGCRKRISPKGASLHGYRLSSYCRSPHPTAAVSKEIRSKSERIVPAREALLADSSRSSPAHSQKTKPTRLIGQPRLYARTEKAPRRQSEPVSEAALSSPMHKGESQLQI